MIINTLELYRIKQRDKMHLIGIDIQTSWSIFIKRSMQGNSFYAASVLIGECVVGKCGFQLINERNNNLNFIKIVNKYSYLFENKFFLYEPLKYDFAAFFEELYDIGDLIIARFILDNCDDIVELYINDNGSLFIICPQNIITPSFIDKCKNELPYWKFKNTRLSLNK